jgi:DNA-directed RNA polymerase subunit H
MKAGFNVAKHILVPKHRKLSDKEKRELLDKFKIAQSDLPRISASDPAVAQLKSKPGDVVQITRRSPTAGESFYYRCVVHG